MFRSLVALSEMLPGACLARACSLVCVVGWIATGLVRNCVAAEPAPVVQAVEPDIYYLRDDGGRLVPVPGFRYRDFVELLRMKDGLPGLPQPPMAVLERVEVTGDLASAGPGSCDIEVRLTVRKSQGGWARMPVALTGFLVTGPPVHDGEGRFLLEVDAAGGYTVWLEAAAESSHVLTLVGATAINRGPAEEIVRLDLPRATASAVRLHTSREDPLVDVQPAAGAIRVVAAAPGESGSTIECAGLAGAATIRVRDRRDVGRPGEAPPQAVVESAVRIDGTLVATTASIRLEGLPTGSQDLSIGLPPGARLERVGEPAALLRVEGTPERPEAVVRVQADATRRAVVELVCERPIDGKAPAAIESLGFAVAGVPAWRQRGRMSLVVEGDWQVEWDEIGDNRRVDPPITARRPGFVAAFAYDAQPASLPLRVRPRGSRVVVEPTYRYEVGAGRIALGATLRVVVRGAPVSRLVLGLDGWSVDDVGPTGLVDAAAVSTEDGRLVIPFTQPLSGEGTIEVKCSLPIDRSASDVRWNLPVPRADLVGPATVTISSDSDIELLPEASLITGLVRQVAAPPRSGESPHITYRLDGTEGTFAARRRFLPRRVDASVVAQATFAAPIIRVEQTIRFEVAHVPLEFIDLAVPRALLDEDEIEVRQAGERLQPSRIPAATDAPDVSGILRVMLARPVLGAGSLTLAFTMPFPDVPEAATVGEMLPLVLPVDVRVVRQSLSLVATEPLLVEVRGDAWVRDVASQSAGPSRVWVAASPAAEVPLALALRPESGAVDTAVEAAWHQTRLLPDRRDDVHTYAIVGPASQVRITLPPGSAPSGDGDPPVRFRVDGGIVSAAKDTDGTMVVPLPRLAGETGPRGCILEIESSRARPGTGGGAWLSERLVLEAPQFAQGTVLRRFYWELHLETDEHVVVPPGLWTSQQRWRWGAFGLEYAPLVSQSALGDWIAAAAQRRPTLPAIPVAERRFVYAGVGDPGVAAVWLVPTWLLVLCASGATLGLGLAVIYRASLRRVAVLVSLGASAALAASWAPDLAILSGLAALPGLALAVAAGILRLVLDRPPNRTSVPAFAAELSTRYMPAGSIVISPGVAATSATVTTRGEAGS